MEGTPSPVTVSTKLQKVAKLAREAPGMAITSLSHHIDIDFLHEAYRLTRKDGAVGVDGQTAKDYEENLHENLENLLNRFKSGSYKAPPVRRVYIPKGDGTKTRPIGIPTFEDKVLQRAVTMLLEAVYEHETRGQPLKKEKALSHLFMSSRNSLSTNSFFDTLPSIFATAEGVRFPNISAISRFVAEVCFLIR